MAYEKRTWVSGVTKCSAENFNHIEDGIETAQKGVDELNTKIVYESMVVNPQNDWFVLSKKEGYCLINAYNGDRDSNNISITSIQKQGSHYILFFQQKVTNYIRIEVIWIKTS